MPDGAVVSVRGRAGEITSSLPLDISLDPAFATMPLPIDVSQSFTEGGRTWVDNQTYIISFVRMASTGPTRVESFLPAPGQFVNQPSWSNPNGTLGNTTAGVSLGSFGGQITFYFADPIVNDPRNPYGIYFIVMGNAFASTPGAAEPGA